MALLSIQNLTFRYPLSTKNILEDVSLDIEQGDFILLFGPSGSGKTTLLRHLKPVLAPNGTLTGGIQFSGKDLKQLPVKEQATEIAFVMQNPENQMVTDKVWHELVFSMENARYSQEKNALTPCRN